jgi:hypothetical protein
MDVLCRQFSLEFDGVHGLFYRFNYVGKEKFPPSVHDKMKTLARTYFGLNIYVFVWDKR